ELEHVAVPLEPPAQLLHTESAPESCPPVSFKALSYPLLNDHSATYAAAGSGACSVAGSSRATLKLLAASATVGNISNTRSIRVSSRIVAASGEIPPSFTAPSRLATSTMQSSNVLSASLP